MSPSDAVIIVHRKGFVVAVDQAEAGQRVGVVIAAAGVIKPVFADAKSGVAEALEGVIAASGAAGADFDYEIGWLADFVDDVSVGDFQVRRVDSDGDEAVGGEPGCRVVGAVEAEVHIPIDDGVAIVPQPGFQGLVGAGDLLGMLHIVVRVRGGVGQRFQVGVVAGRGRSDGGFGGH